MKIFASQETTKIFIDDKKEYFIIVKDEMCFGELQNFIGMEGEVDQIIGMISIMVIEWNFKDEKGKIVDITVDNIKGLTIEVVTKISSFLTEKINKYQDKKKSIPEKI